MARTLFLTRRERVQAMADAERCAELVQSTALLTARALSLVLTAPTPAHRANAVELHRQCVERVVSLSLTGTSISTSALKLATTNIMGREGNRNAARPDVEAAAIRIAKERTESFTKKHGYPPTDRWLASRVHEDLLREMAEQDVKVFSAEHIRKKILPTLRRHSGD